MLLGAFATLFSLLLMSGLVMIASAVVVGIATALGVVPLVSLLCICKPLEKQVTNNNCLEFDMKHSKASTIGTNVERDFVSMEARNNTRVLSCFSSKILSRNLYQSKPGAQQVRISDIIINFRRWEVPYVVLETDTSEVPLLVDTNDIEMRSMGLCILGDKDITKIKKTKFEAINEKLLKKSDYDNYWYDVLSSALMNSEDYWQSVGVDSYFPVLCSKGCISSTKELISLKEMMAMKITRELGSTMTFKDFVITSQFMIKYATAFYRKHFFANKETFFLSTLDLGTIDPVHWSIELDQKQHQIESYPKCNKNQIYDKMLDNNLEQFFSKSC